MLLNIVIGILIFLAIIGSLFVYTLFIWNKAQGKIQEEVAMQMKMKAPNPFDNLIASGKDGMEIINKFIKVEYNKFLHNKLIGLEEDGKTSIQAFLSYSREGNYMTDFIIGFIGVLNSVMSDGMKRFFNRYYKILDEEGNVNENFSKYVTEWVNESIRCLQMRFIVGDGDVTNYSTDHTVKVSNAIFIGIENEVYEDLGINIPKQPEQIKQDSNLGGK